VNCGRGVWLAGAPFANHSCEPNCEVVQGIADEAQPDILGSPALLRIVTTKPVVDGEELTISYTDANAPLAARRERLASEYRFRCACARCVKEEEQGRQARISYERSFARGQHGGQNHRGRGGRQHQQMPQPQQMPVQMQQQQQQQQQWMGQPQVPPDLAAQMAMQAAWEERRRQQVMQLQAQAMEEARIGQMQAQIAIQAQRGGRGGYFQRPQGRMGGRGGIEQQQIQPQVSPEVLAAMQGLAIVEGQEAVRPPPQQMQQQGPGRNFRGNNFRRGGPPRGPPMQGQSGQVQQMQMQQQQQQQQQQQPR